MPKERSKPPTPLEKKRKKGGGLEFPLDQTWEILLEMNFKLIHVHPKAHINQRHNIFLLQIKCPPDAPKNDLIDPYNII